MAKKLLRNIPEDATKEAIRVVEALEKHDGVYVLAPPPKYIASRYDHGIMYLYHVEDYLANPRPSNALARFDFKNRGKEAYPLTLLWDFDDDRKLRRVREFQRNVLKPQDIRCEFDLNDLEGALNHLEEDKTSKNDPSRDDLFSKLARVQRLK